MEIDCEKIINDALQKGIAEGITSMLSSNYHSPLHEVTESAVKSNASEIESVLSEAITGLVNNPNFRKQIIAETQSVLAKKLVQRFGGELEKQVNALKSDPTTRARITMAIEDIVASK